jgi:uncharacterized protein
MQLLRKLEIQSKTKVIEFLNSQSVGRMATIDAKGYPQIIPMNFVYINADETNVNLQCMVRSDAIYMHSHPVGEKLNNIRNNPQIGFEVDQHICFLPSYYFHPSDASQADTLYISIVIKGCASIVEDNAEKAKALNSLMKKYQKEEGYKILNPYMQSVQEVTVIKIVPKEMRGKYKIGQHWAPAYRLKIAGKILQREGIEKAKAILDTMGIEILSDSSLKIKQEPVM